MAGSKTISAWWRHPCLDSPTANNKNVNLKQFRTRRLRLIHLAVMSAVGVEAVVFHEETGHESHALRCEKLM